MAGGATRKPSSAITGSCVTITMTSAISDSRSRPTALISRLRTCVTEFAPAVRRARNSDECRSEKNATLSLISLANNRRWLLARIALLIFDRITWTIGRRTLEDEDHDGDP